MAFGKQKTPTHAEKVASATAVVDEALSSFKYTAARLEQAANTLDDAAVAAKAEADQLTNLAETAAADASNNRTAATKIRALVEA